MSNIQGQLESIPGYGLAMDKFNEYAEEHWNGKTNPYYDESGKKVKLPPDITTKQEQKAWKRIQSQAWQHDKCLFGSCGVGMDCGVGLVPFVVLFFPVLGPLVMYALHSRLIEIANKDFHLPNKLIAQMQANIGMDLLITFPPVIGSFFGWLHGCSTRNAGLIYVYIVKMAKERAAEGGGAKYAGRGTAGTYREGQYFGDLQPQSQRQLQQQSTSPLYQLQQMQPAYTQSRGFKRSNQNTIVVDQQQQSGFM
ncbi:hypothetical protein KGF56_004778 [Candida oxycetoniae]|uniref:Uncharacterized protein n=1 Tax=Candida oxycetoniae TaxID=497107 RepID=A0AAI9SSJ7_9ASCO|nr:uncharacterized protein KGF56_004778 [Candida oxycetoniae]KAI3402370.2 hypothetical protein KGF56_004778 [Candida oxycetoniae]